VRNVAQIIAALKGRAAKCLVVDLDNTLWGGVVGDDGPERLVIGEGDARGEAYAAFQRYILRLKERGVMLAVASKNDESDALEPFRSRPEMILRRDDFLAFQASWRPKSESISEIARELNIGLDAIVFVDDNPAEREQVRQALSEVRVLELGDDPTDYPMLLDQSGWFDTVVLSTEDRVRSTMYRSDVPRLQMRSNVTDYTEYLRSLNQRAVIAPFEERFLDRITQLTNKTNQFNLTTRRLSRSRLAEMMTSDSWLTAYVRLSDRFGDNGLISVLAARSEGTDLWIDLWLMSCRVFNRGVERHLCNHVVAAARADGYRRIHGLYIPTAKNGIVKELYTELGFEPLEPLDGNGHWVLDVVGFRPFETEVTTVNDYDLGSPEAE
jgi:FkbH-like protein